MKDLTKVLLFALTGYRGNLSFTSNVGPTSTGTFTATVSPAPEPSSLLSLCAGGLALVCVRFRISDKHRD